MNDWMNFDLGSPESLRAAIAVLQREGVVGLATLLRDGMLAGRCALAGVARRDMPFPAGALAGFSSPTIVLVGDDDDTPTGPQPWRCAMQAGRWAEAAMIHGAGAEERHYRAAIAAAAIVRRVLVVETSSKHVDAWASFLRHPHTLLVRTGEGLPHPKPHHRGDLH